jgi:tetratricopeptide (TPR) repeat protein
LSQCDHFEVLDIERDASPRQVRAAFYQLLETFKLQEAHEIYESRRDLDLAQRLLDRATVAYRILVDEEARQSYLEALEKNRTADRVIPPRILADVEAQKGELALGAKHYDEAKRLFRLAIDMYPVEPGYFHKLGLAGYLQALERTPADQPLPESVRKPFERALLINPSYGPPRFYLANISRRNGDTQRALQELEDTLRIHPGNKQAQAAIAQIQKQMQESQSNDKEG